MSTKISVIVDDDSIIRMLLRRVLQGEGFQVIEAEDGAQALEIIRTLGSTLKLLVSDVQMPKLDGLTLSGIVNAEFPAVPIILISGNFECVRRVRQQRQFGCVEKPFHFDTLLNVVRTVMGSHTVSTTTANPAASGSASPHRI